MDVSMKNGFKFELYKFIIYILVLLITSAVMFGDTRRELKENTADIVELNAGKDLSNSKIEEIGKDVAVIKKSIEYIEREMRNNGIKK